MDKDIELKLKDYIQKSKKKCFALRDWIQRQCKPFGVMEALECLFVASGGKVTVMDDIISQITIKEKHYGRGQVYNDTPRINSIDIVKQRDGSLELIGYNGASNEPRPKGQYGHDNPNIFRKSDGQVSKTYLNAEDRIMDLGAEVRKLYPDASVVFLTQAMIAIRKYAAEHKISSNRVVSLIKRERLKLDDEDFKVKPTNENKNRKTIMITEMVAKQFSEMMEMTEYKFHNCIKKYLHDLLVDPVNAQVSKILKCRGFNRGKLVALLKNNDLLRKQEKIVDKDENGKYRTATMQVKYLVPKKNFERKLRNLYIKMFERNLPPRTYIVTEEGAAGGGSLGGATSADSSGQFSQPLFPMQRRKMYDVSEDTTTNSVGDYQYDVPFIGDKETLSRQNGQGGSTSINIDEATMNENDNHKYYDYLEDYDTYEVLMMFMDKSNPWMPLINPDMYKRACEEFVKYGEFQRFPTKYIYQWMGIIMKNTAILRELTALSGHDSYFPEDDFRDFFFGDEDRNEQGQSWEEWCEECGETGFYAAYAYLENLGFGKWAKLPDGSDAISDYGIEPIEKLISQYDENMSPEQCLVLVNKILDVVHCRGDLASAFITGGSKSCQNITYRQNESVTKSINLINEYLDKNMRRVRQGIEKGRDEFGNIVDNLNII